MNGFLKTVIGMLCLTIVFQGCSEDSDSVADTGYTTTTYDFPSRFVDGASSVAYTGQVVRNVLIKDLKSRAGGNTSTDAEMLDLYTNGSGNCSSESIINSDGTVQDSWDDFSGNCSRIENKIVQGDNLSAMGNLLGYGTTPDAQMKTWFSEVPSLVAYSDGSSTRYVRSADSLELNQMIGKGLLGVVAYYQGTSVYMPKIDTDDNSVAETGDPYTAMEHHWDESFGYFGCARDYNDYTDDSARKSSYDSNSDGSIDYLSEYNFAWATYAAKRDIDCAGTCTSDNDFTGDIFGAYLAGRTLIHNEGALTAIQAERLKVVNAWEKMVASNVIHYANAVSDKITAGNVSIIHAWAEMRAFAMALQYNSYKIISDSVLSEVITLMGNAPPAASDWTAYQTSLTQILDKLQTAYSFDDANMSAW